MTKITNLDQLRNKVLETFEKLLDGEVDISQASCIAKLSETVISGLKAQMQYAAMTNSQPYLPFLGECTIAERKEMKKLTHERD